MQVSGTGTPNTTNRKVLALVPQSASTAITSTGFDIRGYEWVDIQLLLGAMTANATLDLTVEGSDALGGTYAAIPGAVMAQRVAATHASKPWSGQINVRNLPKNANSLECTHLRIVATCATAASLFAVECILMGGNRTERIQAAQVGSSPAATPLTATDTLFSI